MSKARAAVIASLVVLVTHPVSSQQIDWDKAEREIRRLAPSAFPKLPSQIVAALKAQGCTVPQVYDETEPNNVVTGSFADRRQVDWVVLCSRGGKSSMIVFWGGPTKCPANPLEKEDRKFLQGIGGDAAGYSRQIRAISRDKMLQSYFNVEGGSMPPLDHQGIEHLFVNKTSVTFYCYQGTWLMLTGEGH